MNVNQEYLIPGELTVARGVIGTDVLPEVREDVDYLGENWPGSLINGPGIRIASGRLEQVKHMFGTALNDLVGVLEVPEFADVAINTYSNGMRMPFHTDSSTIRSVVVDLHGGAFDYARYASTIPQAERSAMRVLMNPGDVVITPGKRLHRGVNLSSQERQTVCFFTPK